jgi:hypothetical protein
VHSFFCRYIFFNIAGGPSGFKVTDDVARDSQLQLLLYAQAHRTSVYFLNKTFCTKYRFQENVQLLCEAIL